MADTAVSLVASRKSSHTHGDGLFAGVIILLINNSYKVLFSNYN